MNSYDNLKNKIIDNYDGIDDIILSSNNDYICQITNSLNELNLKNNKNIKYNVSIIELGECEKILKESNGINNDIPLILFKLEMNDNTNNSTKKNVFYEVINPLTREKLDISICDKEKIIINIPTILSDYALDLYKNGSELGYDIFDKKDKFYNDICTKFTSNYSTDITLSDRRKEYYLENEIYCQEGCEYEDYNIEQQLLKCVCDANNKLINNIKMTDFNTNNNITSFLNIKTYANLEVIKCYYLLFQIKGIIKNYGFYIMIVILFLYILIMLIFYTKYNKNISYLISLAADIKKKIKIKYSPIKKSNKIKKTKQKFLFMNKTNSSKRKNLINTSKTKILKTNNKKRIRILTTNNNKVIKIIPNLKKNKKLNDNELNELEYKGALIFDKRSYFEYYWSLIKIKNILIFAFLPNKDYNLKYAKIALFLISFSLFITINALFFTNKSMHKIFIEKGAFILITQLPKIFYSSIVSGIINSLLRYLGLSERDIIYLKNTPNKKKKKVKMIIIKRLKIKFNIFYLLGFLLLLLFCYYVSVFCAVYINTQIILIKDTAASFGLSLTYPFILYLLPGCFRIPALKNKKRFFLFKLSKFLAFI